MTIKNTAALATFALCASVYLLAIGLTACSADRVPGLVDTAPPDTATKPSALVLSNPLPPTGSFGGSLSIVQAQGTITYASLPSGTVVGGVAALIRNKKDNASATVTAYMFGGGFDPTAIPGDVGDTLELTVRGINGTTLLTTLAIVPAKRRPIVIRTSPPPRKRDVPLNATITIVFSEPVDPQTVTAGSLQLLRGGQPVAGQIRLDTSGTHAEFVPAALLDPTTSYTVAVANTIADRTGDSVQATSFEFTTADAGAAGLSQIAFTACVGDAPAPPTEYCGIHVVNADGTGFRAVSEAVGKSDWDSSPAWSPDGKMIAFTSWRHCAAEGRVSPPNGGNCAREVYVMNADGSGITRLTRLEDTDTLRADFPAWSPDGRRIAFVGTRIGAGSALLTMNPDGSDRTQLVFVADLTFGRPTWSPDGTRMAFSLSNSTTNYHGLHIADADGANITRITTENDAFASWSPDGTRIAFQRRYDDGWHHIHVVDTLGENEVQLTSGTGAPMLFNLTPTWSPDGSRIAFIHTSTPRQLRVIQADGSDLRALLPPAWTHANLPAWTPFGTVPP